jgi:tRNA(adenine34) deaminase
MALRAVSGYGSGGRRPSRALALDAVPDLDAMTLSVPTSPMDLALAEARAAARLGEVPVGAVLVDAQGRPLAQAGNRTRTLNDPTAHAEMLVLRAACAQLSSERLPGCALYVTLEPCAMCAAAISFARIQRLYFGAGDPKGGAVEHGPRFFSQPTCHHAPEVYGGIGEQAAAELLRVFFRDLR